MNHAVVHNNTSTQPVQEEEYTDWRETIDAQEMSSSLKIEENKPDRIPGLCAPAEQWRKILQNLVRDNENTSAQEPDSVKQNTAMTWPSKQKWNQNVPPLPSYEDIVRAAPMCFIHRSKAEQQYVPNRIPHLEQVSKKIESKQNTTIIEPNSLSAAAYDAKVYTRSSPTFVEAYINDTEGKASFGLLDNCASLSLIGRKYFNEIADKPQTFLLPMNLQGVGRQWSNKYTVLPVYFKTRQQINNKTKTIFVKVLVEFHILEDFDYGFCIGMDVIVGYGINIHITKRIATISTAADLSIPLYFDPKHIQQTIRPEQTSVIVTKTITVPPECEAIVSITIGGPSLPQDTDLWIEPFPISHVATSTLGTVARGLYDSLAKTVMFTNLGNQPLTLSRGSKIAQAYIPASNTTIQCTEMRHTVGGDQYQKSEHHSWVPKQTARVNTTMITQAYKTNQLWPEQVLAFCTSQEWTPLDPPGHKPPPEPPPQAPDPANIMDPNDRPHGANKHNEPTIIDGLEFDIKFDNLGQPPEPIVQSITRNIQAFSRQGEPGLMKGVKMTLETEDDKLIPQKLRTMSPAKKEIIDSTLRQLLAWDVIELSNSRISFPVVLVKQNNKVRFCVDYRNLNKYTKAILYPMQRTDEIFDALGGKKYFSILDATRGYHQIEIDAEHQWKTAFMTHRGAYQYKRMPFGLKTAPAIFQRVMDGILRGLRFTAALVYIDDVIIFSNNIVEHATHLGYVLSAAIKAGLKFALEKCHFGFESLKL